MLCIKGFFSSDLFISIILAISNQIFKIGTLVIIYFHDFSKFSKQLIDLFNYV